MIGLPEFFAARASVDRLFLIVVVFSFRFHF